MDSIPGKGRPLAPWWGSQTRLPAQQGARAKKNRGGGSPQDESRKTEGSGIPVTLIANILDKSETTQELEALSTLLPAQIARPNPA